MSDWYEQHRPKQKPALRAVAADDVDWKTRMVFKTAKSGEWAYVGCLANTILILQHDPEWAGKLRYDEFGDRILIGSREWTEDDTSFLRSWLHLAENKYRIDVSKSDAEAAVSYVAHEQKFHPVRDYLNGLQWDGVSRVEAFLVTHFGAPDSLYTRGVSRRWLISAVARIMQPGCKVDYTPVLEGAQGAGKSSGLRALTGDAWFFDSFLPIGDKDAYQNLQGIWIAELAELDSITRGELNKVKAFLTEQTSRYRGSFARFATAHPRQLVFAGTTNETRYLRDATGNRRFWPIPCSTIDVPGIRRDRDQVWAEAAHLYAAGVHWHPNEDAAFVQACREQQEERYQADPWEEAIGRWLQGRDGVTTYDVLTMALSIEPGRITRAEEMRAATVLTRLELTDKRRELHLGKRSWKYYREAR